MIGTKKIAYSVYFISHTHQVSPLGNLPCVIIPFNRFPKYCPYVFAFHDNILISVLADYAYKTTTFSPCLIFLSSCQTITIYTLQNYLSLQYAPLNNARILRETYPFNASNLQLFPNLPQPFFMSIFHILFVTRNWQTTHAKLLVIHIHQITPILSKNNFLTKLHVISYQFCLTQSFQMN